MKSCVRWLPSHFTAKSCHKLKSKWLLGLFFMLSSFLCVFVCFFKTIIIIIIRQFIRCRNMSVTTRVPYYGKFVCHRVSYCVYYLVLVWLAMSLIVLKDSSPKWRDVKLYWLFTNYSNPKLIMPACNNHCIFPILLLYTARSWIQSHN